MGVVDVVVSLTSATLAGLAVGGLVYRRRIPACVLFPAYLGFSALGFCLMSVLPDLFWKPWFRFVSGAVQGALRSGTAFEVALKAIRPPLYVGRKRMRVLLSVTFLATVMAVVLFPRSLRTTLDFALLVESTSYGIAWMFAAFLVVVRYYRVPLDPLHRDIAAGFAVLNVLIFYREGCSTSTPGSASAVRRGATS